MRHQTVFGVCNYAHGSPEYEKLLPHLYHIDPIPNYLTVLVLPDLEAIEIGVERLSLCWNKLQTTFDLTRQECLRPEGNVPVVRGLFFDRLSRLTGIGRAHLFAHYAIGKLILWERAKPGTLATGNIERLSERVFRDKSGNVLIVFLFPDQFIFPTFTALLSKLWDEFNQDLEGDISQSSRVFSSPFALLTTFFT